jgi:drug/metabolite transporter (DMT)-like permease
VTGTRPNSPVTAPRLLVLAAALFTVAIWAGTPIATKLAVAELDPLAVGALRTLLGALAALVILAVAGAATRSAAGSAAGSAGAPVVGTAGRLALPRSRSGRSLLAVSALTGFVLFPPLFSLGLERTSAAHCALALAILPLFTGLITAVAERVLPGRRWWFGAAVALGGTLLLVDQRFGLSSPGASLTGDLLVLLSCAVASAGYVSGGRAAREVGARAVTYWGLALGGLVLLPLTPWLTPPQALAGLSVAVWGSLLYLGLLSSIAAYLAWYWALAQSDMGRTGLAQFLQPPLTLLLAAAILGEALTWPLLLAGAVIVAGVAIVQTDAKTSKKEKT